MGSMQMLVLLFVAIIIFHSSHILTPFFSGDELITPVYTPPTRPSWKRPLPDYDDYEETDLSDKQRLCSSENGRSADCQDYTDTFNSANSEYIAFIPPFGIL